MTDDTLNMLRVNPSVSVASSGQTLIAYWCGPVADEDVDALVSILTAFDAQQTKMLYLAVMRPDAGTPNATQRQRIAALSKSLGSLEAMGFWITADGFVSSIMRSALTTLSLMSRYPFEWKAFNNRQNALTWLQSFAPITHLDRDLREFMKHVDTLYPIEA